MSFLMLNFREMSRWVECCGNK